jgi:hypothetical protein
LERQDTREQLIPKTLSQLLAANEWLPQANSQK